MKRSEIELRSSAKRKRRQDLGRTPLKMTRGRLCKVLVVTSYYEIDFLVDKTCFMEDTHFGGFVQSEDSTRIFVKFL